MLKLYALYKNDIVEIKEINLRVNGFSYIKFSTGEEERIETKLLRNFHFLDTKGVKDFKKEKGV